MGPMKFSLMATERCTIGPAGPLTVSYCTPSRLGDHGAGQVGRWSGHAGVARGATQVGRSWRTRSTMDQASSATLVSDARNAPASTSTVYVCPRISAGVTDARAGAAAMVRSVAWIQHGASVCTSG